jgi:hypothetical protein
MKRFMFTNTNKMIKHTFLILCLFVGLNTVAQNQLQFNRVIDTILVVDIGATAIDVSTKHIGETLSPPSGKVWKINNIQCDPGYIKNYAAGSIIDCFLCSNPTQDVNDVNFGIDIYDGNNYVNLNLLAPSVGTNAINLEAKTASTISFPIWINSSSSLRSFVVQSGIYHFVSTSNRCVRNWTAKAYVSLIEFNIVE